MPYSAVSGIAHRAKGDRGQSVFTVQALTPRSEIPAIPLEGQRCEPHNMDSMSTDWRIESDACILSHAGLDLRLRSRSLRSNPNSMPRYTDTEELPRICLLEWTEYRLVDESADEQALVVTLNGRPIPPDPDGHFWPFSFENQIGKTTIGVHADGKDLPPLVVEVLSKKFPEPVEHLSFFRALLDDLVERCIQLPFAFASPTVHAVVESPVPPSPLFVFHFLRQHEEALKEALTTVLQSPHRELRGEESLVPIGQVTSVGPWEIDWIVNHPADWAKAPHLPVAKHLGGYAPSRVPQEQSAETLDTPPNRFVRYFIEELLRWLGSPSITRCGSGLQAIRSFLEWASRCPMFDEIGQMTRFPVEAQVLLRRPGYRELLQLWRLFNVARQPFFGLLQEAIDSRNIATLYEFWCFFALTGLVAEAFGAEPSITLAATDEGGIEAHKTFSVFADTPYRLVYNQGFGPPRRSYSVLLRPDFSLMDRENVELVFDAKFRFDLTVFDESADTPENERSETAVRRAKKADLYKMHTYRDALRARAAVAVYPGDEAAFFALEEGRKRQIRLEDLLASGGPAGIGALPLRPGLPVQHSE